MRTMTSRVTRCFDGPDALRVGKTPPPNLPPAQIALYGDATDLVRGQELFAMRVRSELFEGDTADLWIGLAHKQARDTGTLVYDCHKCHITYHVTPDAAFCPRMHRI